MKAKRLLALALAVMLMLTAFAGCGKKDSDEEGKKPDSGENQAADAGAQEEKEFPELDLTKGFSATKVGSFKFDGGLNSSYKVGLTYYKDGKWGIISPDGKRDTGAKYTEAIEMGKYFRVSTKTTEAVENIQEVNCRGLVDAYGKEIVPMAYAEVEAITYSERYYIAYTAKEVTDNKDEACMFFTDELLKLRPDDDDVMIKGSWCIYDAVTGKIVPGATGTKGVSPSAKGDVIKFRNDAGEDVHLNSNGTQLPKDATVLDNGCYYISTEDSRIVYDPIGTKLFERAKDGYSSLYAADSKEYLFCESKDGKYVLIDKNGTVVSAEFTKLPSVADELLIADGKVCNFDGNVILNGSYDTIKKDEITNGVWYVSGSDGTAFIKRDGTVLFKCGKNEGISTDKNDMTARNDVTKKFYSFADKDYTIDATALSPWLVQTSGVDNTYDITDTLTGKKIIEGYKDYSYIVLDGEYFIFADAGDSVDIYKIS